MGLRILFICLTASLLTSGCAKGFSSGGVVSTHGKLDFHARDMIVPDFHVGTATAAAPVKCRQANTLKLLGSTDG